MSKIRTRFAPSPTGYLHIGGLRTALFNYLLAKSQGGQVILRIEDTDQKRKVEGAVEKLIEILDWAGLKFDEGPKFEGSKIIESGSFGPYIQSRRVLIYQKYVKELIGKGAAYYCFCSPERLAKMRARQQAEKKPPRYDRHCRHLSEEEIKKRLADGEKYVIRQKMPLDGEVIVRDELRGEIKFKAQELEDHILLKSDGMPTYQLAVVIDDYLMKISHIIRGEEWIPSLPKNILLYHAFGWQPPKFIHLPLTLNKGGGKLSKRQGDVAVEDYKQEGYLPEALLNFCALLGWHPKDDREIFSLNELFKEFNIKDMGVSPAVFDRAKLDYLNGYYIRQIDLDKLVDLCWPYLTENIKKASAEHKKKRNFIKKVIRLERERLKKLSEITELTEFFFIDQPEYEAELLIWKKMTFDQARKNLEKIYELLEKIPVDCWTDDSIEEGIINYLKAKELKIGEYLWPMRVALTGRRASPGPFEVAEVLGREETLRRIKYGIKKARE